MYFINNFEVLTINTQSENMDTLKQPHQVEINIYKVMGEKESIFFTR